MNLKCSTALYGTAIIFLPNRGSELPGFLVLFSSSCEACSFVLLKDIVKNVTMRLPVTGILPGDTLTESLDISDDALTEIGSILEIRRNFSMSVYKDKCMKRRVAIRMRSCRCLDTAAYCHLLRHSEQELDLLKKTLTIHVSQFFRNPSMFEKLQTMVLPYLFQEAAFVKSRHRFLSLGCAGGEEAYSLAIILREYFSRELLQTPVEIQALDIDADI